MEFAANHITAAGYGSAGQRCMAISAVVAVGEAGDALVARLKEKAEEIKVGPGRDAASDMGPVVTPEARDRIVGYVGRGQEAGATLVVDGRGLTVKDHENGFFVGPTLFDQVTSGMDIYTDEIFGPVLVVLRADTFAEAIDVINANQYGNGTAIFTSSGQAARKFQREVQVGMIGINVPIPVPMAFYSFGGWKDSLFGDTHVHGPEGIRFYTRAKAITSRWPDTQYQEHHRTHMHFPTAS
jgi:malonate-semialdehyde dehydrogenase (acetylating)/methylmalonate-semialdehyde dehydrogenase